MKASCNEANQPYVECTLMPTQMRGFFQNEVLQTMKLEKR